MNWNGIIEGATTGVVGAALLAVFSLLRYRVSDQFFRWRLWRDLRNFGFGWRPGRGLTVGIRNWVGRTFTVRSVVVLTTQDHYLATPTGEVMSSSPAEMPNLTWRQKRALKKGDSSVLPSTVTHGLASLKSLMSDPTVEGFATVEPFTQRTFLFGLQLFDAARGDGTPTALRITIEYEAWPGRRKITQRDITGRATDINSQFVRMRELVRKPHPPT